ncbi:DUF2029 domain-containing protein [Nocardioides panacis]|uniref:DUF2029 domain-containing protein n=1 Tax=Nocardioides panacis TaxID=2849501 RepID=A0A975SZ88_9ACTN|nr:glycosyltransferase 87 family protein [Nocardioides panacis]QWZ08684.1 DUF2029 domain-containing protein [Nocardioides panacis]
MPYRDFVFLHPPGIIVALAPWGLVSKLTHDTLGLELARVLTVLVGAVDAGLVVLAARRFSLVGAAAGGLLYAVWRPAVMAETQPRLEPYLSLGLLIALAVLSRHRGPLSRWALVVAGAGLGFALTVKIWAAVPVLVVLLWCTGRWGARAAAHVLAALALTGTAICLPFLLAARGAMVAMVIGDQLGRPRTPPTVWDRLAGGLALYAHGEMHTGSRGVVLVAAAVVAPLLVWTWLTLRPGRPFTVLLVAQLLVLVASPSFYTFYPAYVAPAIALTAAAAVTAVAVRAPHTRVVVRSLHVTAVVVLALLIGGALGSTARLDSTTETGHTFPAALRSSVAGARCVSSDSVGALVLLDAFGNDLRHGCPELVDPAGLLYGRDKAVPLADGTVRSRSHNARWQRDMMRYLRSGQVEVLVRRYADGFGSSENRRLRGLRLVATEGGNQVFVDHHTVPSAGGRS